MLIWIRNKTLIKIINSKSCEAKVWLSLLLLLLLQWELNTSTYEDRSNSFYLNLFPHAVRPVLQQQILLSYFWVTYWVQLIFKVLLEMLKEDSAFQCEYTTVALPRNYNLGHDILELYNVLVAIRLTTSKTKRGI